MHPFVAVALVAGAVTVAARARHGGAPRRGGRNVHPLTESEALAFYVDVLHGLNLATSYNRIRFLSAWRVAEGGQATWNPFNTTWAGGASSRYNSVGVRNYPTREAGLAATVGTLRLRYYPDLRARLERDDPAELVAESPNLKTWGTGRGVARVLASHPGAIPYSAPMFRGA